MHDVKERFENLFEEVFKINLVFCLEVVFIS